MNCIDAIEGTVKRILDGLQHVNREQGLDDTEHIRNVRVVIDGTNRFIAENPEISCEPRTLQKVLYTYAKRLWMEELAAREPRPTDVDPADPASAASYPAYYFDHIYAKGTYPP